MEKEDRDGVGPRDGVGTEPERGIGVRYDAPVSEFEVGRVYRDADAREAWANVASPRPDAPGPYG
jgi:hypothetical protein